MIRWPRTAVQTRTMAAQRAAPTTAPHPRHSGRRAGHSFMTGSPRCAAKRGWQYGVRTDRGLNPPQAHQRSEGVG
jgi:hypothetical protein